MIDLHLHTTASDGLLSPSALLALAGDAGLRVISVTDHDTVAGLADARAGAAPRGIRLVNGIEVTAVEDGRDVHVLGYFFDVDSPVLTGFLARQRESRIRRLHDLLDRLGRLGLRIDANLLVDCARTNANRTIGRPQVADALVAAGHVRDRSEAFDRWLAEGRPGFVPRRGSPVAEVIDVLHAAGGIASLAHPGLLKMDAIIERLVDAGLDAIEVRHSEHDEATEQHYRTLAARFGVARSGGSDFHGDAVHEARRLGAITLSAEDFAGLEALAS